MLLPSTCPGCERPGPAPCPACRAALVPAGPAVDLPAGVDACVALFRYEGPGARLVTGLKYGNRRAAVPWLARALALQFEAVLGPAPPDLVVCPVPTGRDRARVRGFDQADLLARGVARRLRRPRRRLLHRVPGPPQTGRSRAERLAGPGFVGRPSVGGRSVGGPVLLVDDVVTTGATLAAAAGVLRAGGATVVLAAVLAVTPNDLKSRAPEADLLHSRPVPSGPAGDGGTDRV